MKQTDYESVAFQSAVCFLVICVYFFGENDATMTVSELGRLRSKQNYVTEYGSDSLNTM